MWFAKAGRLFEEWVLDQFLKVERQRLNYFSTNDYARRRTSNQLRQGRDQQVARAVADGKRRGSEVGTLAPAVPSTHIGSQAYFRAKKYDNYALARAYGNPSSFITMTCNPRWPEIEGALLAGLRAVDRLDIVARVFHINEVAPAQGGHQ